MPFPHVPAQWKPGQSGNPGGRPKVKLRQMIQEMMAETHVNGVPNQHGWTTAQCLLMAAAQHAMKGNFSYFKELIDSNDGKMPDPEVKPAIDMEAVANEVKKRRGKRKKP